MLLSSFDARPLSRRNRITSSLKFQTARISGTRRPPRARPPPRWQSDDLLRRVLRAPQYGRRALLVGHAVRIADRLELQAPRRLEIHHRLAGRRAFADRQHDTRRNALAFEIGFRRLDVVDIEGDVIAADVAVLRRHVLLV